MKQIYLILPGILLLASCGTPNEAPQHTPDLVTIAQNTGFMLSQVPAGENNFLDSVIPEENIMNSLVLMRDSDRIAAAFWFTDHNADEHMNRLTEYLFARFSKNMSDLVDEELFPEEGAAMIDVFAFKDPAMSNERFLFARIGSTLYEFHVAEGKERWVQGILLELSRGNP